MLEKSVTYSDALIACGRHSGRVHVSRRCSSQSVGCCASTLGDSNHLRLTRLSALVSFIFLSLPPPAGNLQTGTQDLANASLGELMSIKVTSATRKEEALSKVPAAIYVITQDEIRSYLNLPRQFDFDAALYYVSNLPALQVPAYTRADARFGWRVGESTELSLVDQSPFKPPHLEFGSVASVLPTQAVRSVFAKLTFKF